MEQKNNLLQRVYLKAIFPNIIAILGGTINVFIDGILIGQKMGDIGIVAVNQSMVVYLVLCTFGSLFAAGASAESAHAMGEGDEEKGKAYFSLAVELALVFGLVFCIPGVLFAPQIAAVLGSPVTASMIQTYIRITLLGGIFKILLYIPYFYLRLEGRMQQAAASMLTMTGLNIVLDYILLFPMQMGIAGAAWASVLATMIACIMSFYFLCVQGTTFRFRPMIPKREYVREIVFGGSPMASNNLFSALRLLALNSIMYLAGGNGMAAVFAITNNLNEFSICVQNGVPQAGTALLGVYHGEEDPKAVKRLLWLQLKAGVVISALFAAVVILFADQIGILFGSEQNMYFAIFCWAVSLIPATLNSSMCCYYYAIQNAAMANLITILRVFAVTAGVAWYMHDFEENIWLFYPLAEIITAVIWLGYAKMQAKKMDRKDICLLADENGAALELVVNCDPEQICAVSAGITDFCEENALDPVQSMTLSLALEELLMITAEKTLKQEGYMYVRILKNDSGTLLRIRAEGDPYNPLEQEKENLDFMGVQMIAGMAKKIEYQSILGLNTLIVRI